MTPDAEAPALAAGRSRSAIVRFLIIVAVLLTADLVIKAVSFERVAGEPVVIERDPETGVMDPIPPHRAIVVAPKLLALHLTVNHGAVFGLGQGGRWVFVGFSAIATVVILYVFARSQRRQWILHTALASVLAGAFGNLWDRIIHGGVRDMFHLFPDVHLPFGWSWPGGARELYPWIFNFADVCLVVGLVVLMIIIHRTDPDRLARKAEKAEAAAKAADDAPRT